MIHYTCDRCRHEINPARSVRYSIAIEVQRVDEEWNADDEAVDHLDALHQAIESGEDETVLSGLMDEVASLSQSDEDCHGDRNCLPDESNMTDETITETFDLCEACYRRYRSNPLGRERNLSMHFSDN